MQKDVPDFKIGDTVDVHQRILEGAEGARRRSSHGMVIARRGEGMREMFTVRRIVQGEGVERIFPLHSPKIAKIEVKRTGKVRRAKLYYLRDRVGKATRLRERKVKGGELLVPGGGSEKKGSNEKGRRSRRREKPFQIYAIADCRSAVSSNLQSCIPQSCLCVRFCFRRRPHDAAPSPRESPGGGAGSALAPSAPPLVSCAGSAIASSPATTSCRSASSIWSPWMAAASSSSRFARPSGDDPSRPRRRSMTQAAPADQPGPATSFAAIVCSNSPARFDVLAISWPAERREPIIVHHRHAFEAVGPFQMFS